MRKDKLYLIVSIDLEIEDGTFPSEIVDELDYTFKSTNKKAKVTDTEILEFSSRLADLP